MFTLDRKYFLSKLTLVWMSLCKLVNKIQEILYQEKKGFFLINTVSIKKSIGEKNPFSYKRKLADLENDWY